MLEPVLFGFKILFLILLYLFIFIIVRRLSRDLSGGSEPAEMPAATPAAARAPAVEPSLRHPRPAGAAAGAAGTTSEFEDLVTRIKPRLVVQHSKVIENGLIYKLKGGATIGRSAGSDIVLPDDYVSQTHARLFPRKQFFILEDLGSLNGTFVDGRRLEGEHQIKPGQEIVIGETIFRYEE
jgi:hypothetical protein